MIVWRGFAVLLWEDSLRLTNNEGTIIKGVHYLRGERRHRSKHGVSIKRRKISRLFGAGRNYKQPIFNSLEIIRCRPWPKAIRLQKAWSGHNILKWSVPSSHFDTSPKDQGRKAAAAESMKFFNAVRGRQARHDFDWTRCASHLELGLFPPVTWASLLPDSRPSYLQLHFIILRVQYKLGSLIRDLDELKYWIGVYYLRFDGCNTNDLLPVCKPKCLGFEFRQWALDVVSRLHPAELASYGI